MGHVIFYDEKFEWGSHEPHHQYASYWFNLDDYVELDLAYYSSHSDPQKIEAYQLSEVRRWMQTNLDGEVIVIHHKRNSGTEIVLYFENKTDAAAFKLRWL